MHNYDIYPISWNEVYKTKSTEIANEDSNCISISKHSVYLKMSWQLPLVKDLYLET